MSYRYGNRNQNDLFPARIDDYVAETDPVRIYDAFIDAISTEKLGLKIQPEKVGCPAYDPRVMLKLLVYSYSYGWRSSRKIERATHHNISFIWLTGGLKPDHKTIARFRKDNKKALTDVLKNCARLCIEFKLIEGNDLFIDGSKIRANAGINNTWTKKRCEKALEQIDERIKNIINESIAIDAKESNHGSIVHVNESLKNEENRKIQIQEMVKKLEQSDKEKINSTDSDCVNGHSRQGNHAIYNAQVVADGKHGLIVSTDVVNENNDYAQLADQVNNAIETLEKKPQSVVSDAGYANYDELKKIDEQEITVVVPSRKQAENKDHGPFDKEAFSYNKERNEYICPEGHVLKYSSYMKNKKCYSYRMQDKKACLRCVHYGVCTKAKRSRSIYRYINEEFREKIHDQYMQSTELYAKRKQIIEHPFGHIKRNLNAGHFLLRGLEGVQTEMSLLATAFNITRMITIFNGVTNVVQKLAQIRA